MNCPQCNQELNFPEEVLKKFTNCPFCGKPLSQVEEMQNYNVSIETELKRIVNEFGGLEIFSEENSSRFAKALATIDAKFADERDKLLVANIRRIPQKMYTVIDQPQNEQKKVIDSCSDDLIKFGLQKKLIDEIISWLSSEMHFSVALEQMPIVEMENGIAVSKTELRQDRSVDMNETSAAEISQDGPIDDQDIRHWKEDKFFKNVYSSEKFKNADLESKAEMRSAAKEEAKMIKALFYL